jgi:plasmid stability protein
VATLHVRNVPDTLYERLRRRADANGRSIGGEAVAILEEQLAVERVVRASGAPALFFGRRRRSPGLGPFERFSPRGSKVMVYAQEEARALRHAYVGTEHLLLGLLRDEAGIAARALRAVGIEHRDVRKRVEEIVGVGDKEPPAQLAFVPRAKKVLELALRESLALGHDVIDGEHLVLAIEAEGEGVAAQVIVELCRGPGTVREAVLRLLAEAPSEDPYRVLRLTGSADQWTEQLNEAAADGWELVETVAAGPDRRAILRRV